MKHEGDIIPSSRPFVVKNSLHQQWLRALAGAVDRS